MNVRVRGGTWWLEPDSISDIQPPDPDKPLAQHVSPLEEPPGVKVKVEVGESHKRTIEGGSTGEEHAKRTRTDAEAGSESIDAKEIKVEGGNATASPDVPDGLRILANFPLVQNLA